MEKNGDKQESRVRVPCSVIIVTHNSQAYLSTCMRSLKQQTSLPHQIILVDSGSEDSSYLKEYPKETQVIVHLADENIGFCQANNIGMSYVDPQSKYVLFLNPDAFLTPLFIEQALSLMEHSSNFSVGALSGILLGFNIQRQQPTGRIDSSGIFRTWYGRWYDRGQQELYTSQQLPRTENVPALCGALMFCRLHALQSVELAPYTVMDPTFYMYKEDIDLSLRLRQKGWLLLLAPQLIAYHCRGWQERAKIPYHLRLLSARNEMRLYARLKSPFYLYSLLKYLLVKIGNY